MNEVKYNGSKPGDQIMIAKILGNWRKQDGKKCKRKQKNIVLDWAQERRHNIYSHESIIKSSESAEEREKDDKQ